MGTVKQVIGPPGTGKTQSMAKWLADQASTYGADNLLVCSYTKAASREIRTRMLDKHGVEVPQTQMGTLHSLCYRALGSPKLTEGLEREFSVEFPQHGLSGGVDTSVDSPLREFSAGKTCGDDNRSRYELQRASCKERDTWPSEVQRFARDWEAWKKSNDLMDFGDLLEVAYRDLDAAPGNPAIGVLDEAQDSPENQMRVFLKWARSMQQAIVAGDPDQTLYQWCGSSPRTMIDMPLVDGARHVLSQSYRIPEAVHEVAERWIRKSHSRLSREYFPRLEDPNSPVSDSNRPVVGKFTHLSVGFLTRPDSIVASAMKHVEAGKSVMIIASCSYMVDKIKHHLYAERIPFANRWREQRGDWNPMRMGGKQATTFRRLLSFLRPSVEFSGDSSNSWTWADVWLWGEWLNSERMWVRGAKKWLEERKKDESPFDPVELASYVRETELPEFENLSFGTREDRAKAVDWWLNRVSASHKNTAEYLCGVVKKFDVEALKEPRISLGTCHSVKGGESDVVYLSPDLSKVAYMQSWLSTGETRDGVRRMLYVGMTRAREELVLCGSDGQFSLEKAILNGG